MAMSRCDDTNRRKRAEDEFAGTDTNDEERAENPLSKDSSPPW
jgi:hypothetical protein